VDRQQPDRDDSRHPAPAYGTPATKAFWRYRLASIGLIFASVVLLLLALGAQVAIDRGAGSGLRWFPRLDGCSQAMLATSRWISAPCSWLDHLLLFETLTPQPLPGAPFPSGPARCW
jgi:membrane protein